MAQPTLRIRLKHKERPMAMPRFPEAARKYGDATRAAQMLHDKAFDNAVQAALQYEQEVATIVTGKDEASATHAVDALFIAPLMPYTSYLEAQGFLEPGDDRLGDHLRQAEAQIWEAIGQHAQRESENEGVVLTPLLNKLLRLAYNAGENEDRWPEGQKAPLGQGLEKAEKNLAAWAQDATLEEIQKHQKDIQAGVALNAVAKHSKMAATPEGLARLTGVIQYRLSSAIQNANLPTRAQQSLVDFAITTAAENTDNAPRDRDLKALWKEVDRQGIRLDKRQKMTLRMYAETCRQSHSQESEILGMRLAQISELCQDEQALDALTDIQPRESETYEILVAERLAQLLISNTGQSWLKVATQLLTSHNNPQPLAQALAKSTGRNLKGLGPADLLPLVDAKDDDVRAQGRRLMTVAQENEQENAREGTQGQTHETPGTTESERNAGVVVRPRVAKI